MCGIHVYVHCAFIEKHCGCVNKTVPQIITRLLTNRGPNSLDTQNITKNNIRITATGAVLHQRGNQKNITSQPIINDRNNFLLWNGEIFGGFDIQPESNDAKVLLDLLSKPEPNAEHMLDVLGKVEGPFAFTYWCEQSKKVWFGRDVLGRRSLLWKYGKSGNCVHLQLSSVSDDSKDWEEVPTRGIFCLEVSEVISDVILECFEWTKTPTGSAMPQNFSYTIPVRKGVYQIKSPILSSYNATAPLSKQEGETTCEYICKLYELENCENLAELINNPKAITSAQSISILAQLVEAPIWQSYVNQFVDVLKNSIDKRVNNQTLLCKTCINDSELQDCPHANLGILFSGGLDSIVLAVLVDKCMKSHSPIDLLNVSFEHSNRNKKANSGVNKSSGCEDFQTSFDSPDRVTGIQGYEELMKICPTRKWNFVVINVTTTELKEARDNRIKYLINPSETVLDDSIGCATWFAARGQGLLVKPGEDSTPYTSPSRVVIVGMGADEQLGGYSRHRQKYSSGGWKALISEMNLEIDRIASRNLGRDDRIISDHGREARFPFLDEKVVAYLNRVPIHFKLNLELPRGLGEKCLLRMVAYSLKLRNASVLQKRAIQFGSRIAKSEGKEKGSDLCKRL